MMRALLSFMLLLAWPAMAAAQEASTEDQAVLAALSRPVAIPGGPLWLTILTDRSIEALWRDDAARGTLQIEVSNAGTAIYVMGLATRPVTIAPTVVARQGADRFTGKVVNMAYLDGTPAPKGAVILGLLEFDARLDLAKPFVIELSNSQAPFAIDAATAQKWGKVTRPKGQGF